VDDTNLIVTHRDLTTPEAVLEKLHKLADTWSLSLNSTDGAISPEKIRLILALYEWVEGLWRHWPQSHTDMTIPLPDSTRAHTLHWDVSTVEKLLGVWSTINGNNSKHIEENVTGKTKGWINKMRNAHLPVRLGWVVYRFKLWAGIWYGIVTLSIPLTLAKRLLHIKNFQSLSFLGINQNVKRN
jgi:hypothetical protein